MQFIFWKKTANYVWDHSRVAIEKKKMNLNNCCILNSIVLWITRRTYSLFASKYISTQMILLFGGIPINRDQGK